jgi:hypothetical protein
MSPRSRRSGRTDAKASNRLRCVCNVKVVDFVCHGVDSRSNHVVFSIDWLTQQTVFDYKLHDHQHRSMHLSTKRLSASSAPSLQTPPTSNALCKRLSHPAYLLNLPPSPYFCASNTTFCTFILSNISYPSTASLNGITLSAMNLKNNPLAGVTWRMSTLLTQACLDVSSNSPAPLQTHS